MRKQPLDLIQFTICFVLGAISGAGFGYRWHRHLDLPLIGIFAAIGGLASVIFAGRSWES